MYSLDKKTLIDILKLKVRFGFSSVIATGVDYGLYLLLVEKYLSPVYSNLISASIGMIINFMLQRRYIFQLQRKAGMAFLISLGTSLVGVGLSTGLIYLFNKIPFFYEHQYITKALVIALIFNYNFYMKRFAFEKRFLP